MKKWYYAFSGQFYGPFTEDEMHDMIQKKKLTLDDLVWNGDPNLTEHLWLRIKDTELAPENSFLNNVILYVISRSDQKKFSYSKLENYLILIDRNFPLGISVDYDRFGMYVVQLKACISFLKESKLLEEHRPKTKKKSYRRVFKLCLDAPLNELPEKLKIYIDHLILQYDKASSKRMLNPLKQSNEDEVIAP